MSTATEIVNYRRRFVGEASKHGRIIWAIIMRELSSRYGRQNIGYLWVIAEPLIFAGGVSLLWTAIRPPYDHGIKIVPFVVTGYMPLILIRQTTSWAVNAVRVNHSLLYHRQITPLHLFCARIGVEFLGVSLAFVTIVSVLCLVGIMSPPKSFLDLGYVYAGWFILTAMSAGLALILGALGEIFEFVERFVQVITYILIPLSGAFFMASWLPEGARKYLLFVPFIHCFEMIRRGFFGEAVVVYYNVPYAIACSAGFILVGLLLAQFVRDHVEVQ
jgi:capsular polysaccharide transport system permease protein